MKTVQASGINKCWWSFSKSQLLNNIAILSVTIEKNDRVGVGKMRSLEFKLGWPFTKIAACSVVEQL